MRASATLLAALTAAGAASATPTWWGKPTKPVTDANPFKGKEYFVNPEWTGKLDQTYNAFKSQGKMDLAARVRKVQKISTFVWVSRLSELPRIDDTIKTARTLQRKTGKKQIIGLVLYNLPDRDCSAGESAGEFKSEENGLQLYKDTFVKPYAAKVAAANDLEFAIVLEPDSLGNLVTNMGIEFCAGAADIYRDGIAYAISQLQLPNVHLYIDAAHGGWLGWDPNLPLAAKEFAEVVKRAGEIKKGSKVRGFATNVSNYNPYNATGVRENYTEWSNSWDESHYAASLTPFLEEEGLPAHFIVDQGRVHLPGAREEWGEWCNVAPAGFGQAPTTKTNSTVVDSIVWIKPGGECDGTSDTTAARYDHHCGLADALKPAPEAGQWFQAYFEQLLTNANPAF